MRISLLKTFGLALPMGLLLLFPASAQAACNEGGAALFLEIDGTSILGENECLTLNREDSIAVLGFSSSLARPGSAPGGGIPTLVFQPVTIVKPRDRTTPLLNKALVLNEAVSSAEIRFYSTAGGPAVHTYTILLENAFISGISSAAGKGDEEPTEAVSFTAGQITWTDELGGTTHTWTWGS